MNNENAYKLINLPDNRPVTLPGYSNFSFQFMKSKPTLRIEPSAGVTSVARTSFILFSNSTIDAIKIQFNNELKYMASASAFVKLCGENDPIFDVIIPDDLSYVDLYFKSEYSIASVIGATYNYITATLIRQ